MLRPTESGIGAAVPAIPSFSKQTKSKTPSARELYYANCARCHGPQGKGDTELGMKLNASDLTSQDVKKLSRARVTRLVRNGKGDMPGFAKKLSARDIDRLASYIRTLK